MYVHVLLVYMQCIYKASEASNCIHLYTLYVPVYTMYWHVYACIYLKNWKAIESWPHGQSLTLTDQIQDNWV